MKKSISVSSLKTLRKILGDILGTGYIPHEIITHFYSNKEEANRQCRAVYKEVQDLLEEANRADEILEAQREIKQELEEQVKNHEIAMEKQKELISKSNSEFEAQKEILAISQQLKQLMDEINNRFLLISLRS